MTQDQYAEHYQEIGGLLRSARERSRIGVVQAARDLHIRSRYLEALEEGRLEELPGLPYAKGYLQRYANYLELDKDEIIRRFEQVEQLIEKRSFFLPEVLNAEKKPTPAIIWAGLAVAVAVYLLWWAFFTPELVNISMVENYVSPPAQQPVVVRPCFAASDQLYPTCTMLPGETFDTLPVSKSQRATIMELAQ